jgi:hypothetical protein
VSDFDMARYLEWRRTHPPMMGGQDGPDEDATADTADAAQSEATDDTSTDAPPPWGDDFDAARAWNTISHLRGREKELEPVAKALERLRSGEDRDTFREIAATFGYEIPEDDEPDDDGLEDDPVADVRKQVSELAAWRAQQENERKLSAHFDQVNKLAEGAEIALTDHERKLIFNEALTEKGLDTKLTEAAFQSIAAYRDEIRKQAIEGYRGSKKAPTVPPAGKSATQVPDLDSDKDRQKWILDRMYGGN